MNRRRFSLLLIMLLGAAALTVITRALPGAAAGAEETGNSVFRPLNFFEVLFRAPALYRTLEKLKLENEDLRAQILAREREPRVSQGKDGAVIAAVFSSYPFNNQSLLAVAAGSRHGVRRLAPVTVSQSLFLGQVAEVYDRMSVVRTVFDPDWQIPVKIGESRSDALLSGGKTPALSLITGGGEVKEGDAVYTAHRDFPYGLTIGRVIHLRPGPDPALKVADVELPFTLRDVQEVYIHSWP